MIEFIKKVLIDHTTEVSVGFGFNGAPGLASCDCSSKKSLPKISFL